MSNFIKNTDTNIAALNQGSHFADLNGVKLHYQVKGNGPLLFVVSPGWGIGSLYLQRGLDFLTGRFRVVFVDTRGSGLSGRPSDPAMMGSNQMADDLDALRSHLGLSTIVLLGHSNGGAIALSFAQRYADRVSKLILIDSQLFGFAAAEDTHRFLSTRAEDQDYSSAVKLAHRFFSGKDRQPINDDELTEFVGNILALYLNNPSKNLVTTRQQLSDKPISFYAFGSQNAADAAAQNDQTVLLHLVKAPVLIASGRHDWVCPVAVAERMHAGIENSTLEIFEESGHLPWIEEPTKFQSQIFHFLSIG
ncbi:alpha/beta fold hydrolase [Pseudomonas frederiksbergensis]|uniref:Alpha/beta hydrolase n=1 Tax=Pseudomonas frederiksbergensis TaxID=104087 RepID=A0A423HR74_9PSED|nr:alpha/beta hydrolase [Pseudomonas frederiksbergensis]RON15720.1 alpha/beta hydrolase [Pseudomonas frederiksbergensis]